MDSIKYLMVQVCIKKGGTRPPKDSNRLMNPDNTKHNLSLNNLSYLSRISSVKIDSQVFYH